MLIIGCDFHTRYQQIAMANDETGGWGSLYPFGRPAWPTFCGFRKRWVRSLLRPIQLTLRSLPSIARFLHSLHVT